MGFQQCAIAVSCSEEEYTQWENKINKEFVEFLVHIREFVTQKEGLLKEQQVDLCHRERSLQTSEDYFKVSNLYRVQHACIGTCTYAITSQMCDVLTQIVPGTYM